MIGRNEIVRALEIRCLTFLSNLLEEGEKAVEKNWNLEKILGWFENQIDELWTSKEPLGRQTCSHIKTSICDTKAHCLLTQIEACLGFQNLFLLTLKPDYLKKAQNLADYIISHQENNELFLFHWKSYYPQDEGIATFWAIVALLRLFNTTKEPKYLEVSIKAGEAARRYFYFVNIGYIHTMGQKFWTTNANSIAAYAYKLLFEVTQDKKYQGYIFDALTHTVNYQREDGMFMYSGIRPGIYFTYYQSLVTYLLIFFRDSEWDERFVISQRIEKAINYLEGLRQKDGSMIEPDKRKWVCTLSSVITAATYLKTKGILLSENLCFLTQFITPKGLFIFKKDERVFLKHRRGFRDYYTAEIFNWLTIIALEKNIDRVLK